VSARVARRSRPHAQAGDGKDLEPGAGEGGAGTESSVENVHVHVIASICTFFRERKRPEDWVVQAGYAQRFARSTAFVQPAIHSCARSRDNAGSKTRSTRQLAATSAASFQ